MPYTIYHIPYTTYNILYTICHIRGHCLLPASEVAQLATPLKTPQLTRGARDDGAAPQAELRDLQGLLKGDIDRAPLKAYRYRYRCRCKSRD